MKNRIGIQMMDLNPIERKKANLEGSQRLEEQGRVQ
jgi:hypothetical protein